LIPNRLVAARKINDAEPAHAAGHRRSNQDAFAIRTAMNHRGHHPAHERLAALSRPDSDDAANSTHNDRAPLSTLQQNTLARAAMPYRSGEKDLISTFSRFRAKGSVASQLLVLRIR